MRLPEIHLASFETFSVHLRELRTGGRSLERALKAVAVLRRALERYEQKRNMQMTERVRARLAEMQLSNMAVEQAYSKKQLGHQSTV